MIRKGCISSVRQGPSHLRMDESDPRYRGLNHVYSLMCMGIHGRARESADDPKPIQWKPGSKFFLVKKAGK